MQKNEKLIYDIITSYNSKTQKGDVSLYLLEQGFFNNNEIPKGLKKRDKFLSGGNPIDVKKKLQNKNVGFFK